MRVVAAMVIFCAAAASAAVGAARFNGTSEEKKTVRESIDANVLRPALREVTDARVRSLDVPRGFKVNVFATDLESPRMMVVASDGSIYVTRRDHGDVLRLVDADGDGIAEKNEKAVELKDVHDLAFRGDKVFLVTVKEIYSASIDGAGHFTGLTKVVSDLPDGGQHPNRTLKFDQNGWLYVTVGSTCNACKETSPESATVVRMKEDGTERTVFAHGLRNTIGFDFHPQTGEIWGMDHGMDWLGNERPREELNRIVEGGHYGWPWILEDGLVNFTDDWPRDMKMTREEFAKTVKYPSLTYTAHAAPIGFTFYRGGMFPERYRNGAFVAFRGSWNRAPARGYEVAFARFENGEPVRFEKFLTGFLVDGGRAQFGRPTGLAIAKDGSLLVAEDVNGTIYRVSFPKDQASQDR